MTRTGRPQRQLGGGPMPHGPGRGLNAQAIAAAIERQGGVCLICQRLPTRWDIDHDHACLVCGGERGCAKCFRGMLCSACNSALGFVNDNISTLKRMITYLELARER
jgi:hypothetical protein